MFDKEESFQDDFKDDAIQKTNFQNVLDNLQIDEFKEEQEN